MNVDNTEQSPLILSVCPGILGLERGLERAIGPVRVAAYVEIEAFVIENLVCAMEQGILAPAPIWSDLKTFDGAGLRGKIHGIIGGYPCQPFSNAGNRLGTEDPRHLFPYILGIIQAARPLWCFFENVEGHLELGYDTVYESLSAAGYAVESGIYSAEEAGAPHQRNRLYILAIRRDVANSDYFDRWRKRPNDEQPKRQTFRQSIENSCSDGASEVVNPSSEGLQKPGHAGQRQCGKEDGERLDNRPEQPGNEELAHANGIRHLHRHLHRQPQQHPTETGEHAQREPATGGGHEKLVYNSGEGLQGGEQHRTPDEREQQSEPCGAAVQSGSVDRWPARPGQEQYEWEAPRTVEPGMGCTIDGYNYREDLLRALGNSVVEQTAEIAFRDLLNKHIKNATDQ